ncbi:TPA: TIGR00159 family protein [Candidatus Gastranaerophilales bacterium HUM_9]|nr:MAG TPA: TIGR00159 family protein [Candidatus Gastranaerophilales bacterium HUM_9]HBX35096.1 TIGR00159 family protein [Cyanobacteria bacterium UBA11440]
MLNIFTRHISHIFTILNDFGNTIQILLIVGIVLLFYKRYIQHTNSEKFVRGLLFLFFSWIFSEILIMFNLKILGTFFEYTIALIALSLIVIFQPELRRFLGYLGQPGFFSKTFLGFNHHNSNKDENIDVVKELVEAVKYLTKTKTGALIVLQNDVSPSAYSDVGTKINADVSAELILTIFHPNTPLHDGAMVIKDNKILSSGVLLPLTENPQLSWKYGTRHRAALGLTEINGSACIVVSEETGDVSICMDGSLKKYDDLVTFKEDLEKILCINKAETEKTGFFNFM